MLNIEIFVAGPAMTNAYLVADSETKDAVVIDPAWDGELILAKAMEKSWQINQIWLTHAHFDHLGGIAAIADALDPQPTVALHPDDLWLWRDRGGAAEYGLDIDPGPEPSVELEHGQTLKLGNYTFEVRHAPGHTPGHVMFYCAEQGVLFAGDVIFYGSIGRTDFPKGSHPTLMKSIREQVLSLPDNTRLLTGHGPETLVGFERMNNPFLR